MVGVLAVTSKNIRKDIYKYIGFLRHRGNQNCYYSDGKCSEQKHFDDGAPTTLLGITACASCSSESINSRMYDTYVVVIDGSLSAGVFERDKDPLETINRLTRESEDSFFGICIRGSEVIAFKDKRGSKPGMCGRDDEGNIIISSENMGFEKVDDIYGGEILSLNGTTITRSGGSKDVILDKNEYLHLANNEATIYGIKVYEFKYKLCLSLMDKIAGGVEAVVTCTPESRTYALIISEILGVPCLEPVRVQIYKNDSQKYKYHFRDIDLKYDNVLIVDLFGLPVETERLVEDTFRQNGCKEIHSLQTLGL
jgi:glutamine phosphoribosylpyrophosphate amidotransferase